MSASSPSVCVIIVCRNPGIRLRAALESVWAQTHAAELIVIDGASTDGTRTWLEAQRHRINTLVSETDTGIYDAMNKGIAYATGEWVFFLGADDRLADAGVISGVTQAFDRTHAAILVGEARFDDGRLYSFVGEHTAIRRNFVHHQAAFYRRALFQRHGGFDTRFRIQADYEHNLRLLKHGEKFAPLALRIAECASGGLSDSGRWANYREEITVRHRHFPLWRSLPWDIVSVLRYLRKSIVRNFASTRPE
jgi:putative colanic acid biosynthesis glycosyltransferase